MSPEYPLPSMTHLVRRLQNSDASEIDRDWTGNDESARHHNGRVIATGRKQTKALFDKSEVLPITMIIDRAGNVRGVVQGILYPEEFEKKIKPLLRIISSSQPLDNDRLGP